MGKNNSVMSFKSAAERLNDITYTDYFNRLMLLARSVFQWENLPNGIDEKWIEKYLFYNGCCMFFKDPKFGYMVTRTVPGGRLNYYDEPTRLRPDATNYISIKNYKNNEEAILIRNNDIMRPTIDTIQLYAVRLTQIVRTMDVNINAQKTPVLIQGSDKTVLSLKKTYEKFEGNEPFIHGDSNLDITGLTVLRTDAPIVFDKLEIQKHALFNEAMTFLGINNANMDKRERLVDDEVQANNEQIELSAAVMLKSRQRACDQINALFNEKISVKLRNADEIKKQLEEGVIND